MQKYKLVLWYNGKRYSGFQIQKNQVTVHSELLRALELIYRQKIHLVPAGRTDTGVHAAGQVIHYQAPDIVPEKNVVIAMNGILPEDIRVQTAEKVPADFHAIRSAESREYRYLWSHQDPGLWASDFVTRVHFEPALPLCETLAGMVMGQHDFVHFRCTGSQESGTVREIYKCEIIKRQLSGFFNSEEQGVPVYELRIKGNAFLYRMVRNIVGAMFEVFKGRQTVTDFKEMLDLKSTYPYQAANPKGLCLMNVEYERKN